MLVYYYHFPMDGELSTIGPDFSLWAVAAKRRLLDD